MILKYSLQIAGSHNGQAEGAEGVSGYIKSVFPPQFLDEAVADNTQMLKSAFFPIHIYMYVCTKPCCVHIDHACNYTHQSSVVVGAIITVYMYVW